MSEIKMPEMVASMLDPQLEKSSTIVWDEFGMRLGAVALEIPVQLTLEDALPQTSQAA